METIHENKTRFSDLIPLPRENLIQPIKPNHFKVGDGYARILSTPVIRHTFGGIFANTRQNEFYNIPALCSTICAYCEHAIRKEQSGAHHLLVLLKKNEIAFTLGDQAGTMYSMCGYGSHVSVVTPEVLQKTHGDATFHKVGLQKCPKNAYQERDLGMDGKLEA